MPTLFDEVGLRGGVRLMNRVAMAPMTRSRAGAGDVPSPFAAEYYAQRATAGLLITEGTTISAAGKGYSRTPGIHTDAQEEGWAQVAKAVHARVAGSRIFMQLWHVGRLSNPQISGCDPVAPSPIRAPGAKVWLERDDGWRGNIDCSEPREMTIEDIGITVRAYRSAAARAVRSGFDGVELHAANGYLIDQFMRETTNRRTDEYGGTISRRLRFMRDVVTAVADEIGAARVGVRFSPVVDFGDTTDPMMEECILQGAGWLDEQGISYLHIVEAENQDLLADTIRGPAGAGLTVGFLPRLRAQFTGPIMLAYRYDMDRASHVLACGLADLVAFGRPFIANPDLVDRLRLGSPLSESDTSTWYGGGAEGYIDYPALT